MKITLSPGFSEAERAHAAQLYWQAFSGKLGKLMRPDAKALAFLQDVLNPDFAISARDGAGQLLGLAGFKTADGALVGGELSDIQRHYGPWGGLWRGLLLTILERDLEPGVLLMDGIFVDANARGQGVGTQLLGAILSEARTRDLSQVRLDVIDSNPRARALYEREGFQAGKTEHIGPLRYLFGFSNATRMTHSLS
ncbi:GNAT family N-acetyltransferase [Cognatishimia sp. MH4019]|uniref:GNAT family N-acetyltransferase n=1 Tax=Cognatishimia sp. MH4019 TaxID=2854030 RepID=UPI001CD1E38B|nr:GNAT family N-acetyltransferase [Cognatishimia sp. MH4019]